MKLFYIGRRFLPSFILCLLTIVAAYAQNERFWHLSVEQGLSNSNVTAILQDSDGFMWFGTADGLNKYNGYEMKVYRKNVKDTLGLMSNYINILLEDKNRNVWVGTNGGLAKYNKLFDKFERVVALGTGGVAALHLDDKGNLWAGGWGGLKMLDANSQQWHTIKEFENKSITALQQSSPNDFWIGVSRQGLFHFHLPTKKITQFLHDPKNLNSLTDNNVNRLFYDQKGNLWISTAYGGISRYQIQNKQFTNFKSNADDPQAIRSNTVRAICQDGKDILFAVENGGMSRYNPSNETFTHYLHEDKNPRSIAGNSVWAIYKDRQERIWVGMYSKGISIIDKYKDKFDQAAIDLPNQIINSVIEDSQGRIWVGTEEGVTLHESGKSIFYKHDEKNEKSISANPVMRVFEDAQKRIWAGTWQKGANLYEEEKGTFKRYMDKEAEISGIVNKNCVFAFGNYIDNEQVLFGNYGGINILNKETDKLENFTQYIKQEINMDYVHDIKSDSKGNIWIASLNGLFFFDALQKKLTLYRNIPNDSTSLASHATYTVYEDSKNRIWVGAREGLHLVVSQGKFKRYTTEHGLPNNEVNGIMEDSKGNLWITTNQGLSVFNPEKQVFRNYFESDGLLSKQLRINAIFKNKKGEIFLGTINGLNIFHPDSVRDNPYLPPVLLTDFKIFNQSVKIGDYDSLLKQHISQTKEIVLTHQHSVFSIDFVALNFTQSEKNQYAYKLEGFDRDWNYVGSQRSATYTNLDAGTYTFKVKASNNDGLWNEEGISLKIKILPPWWATWWFRTLAISTILLTAYSLYKTRTNFLKNQNLKLERQVIERTYEIEKKNKELEIANVQIQTKNEELATSAEELRQNMEELEASQELLKEQKQTIEHAFKLLQQQNTKVSDSIRYAQRIQQAILPHEDALQNAFSDHFVIYKPKDVVSGDFYWYFEVQYEESKNLESGIKEELINQNHASATIQLSNNSTILKSKKFLAVVDCTGHGVPGAMMSMMGNSILKEIIETKHIYEPATILTELNKRILDAFTKRSQGFEDGMDIGLCCIENIGNEQVLVKYSGAKRPLYYFDGQLQKVSADKHSIGKKHEQEFIYKQHEFTLHENQSALYLTTDGWADSINAERIRYGSNRLVELLKQVAYLPLQAQKEVLLKDLEDYSTNAEQRDDILFVGVKI
ncbi:ligand-binding sensor domain-containing protein [Thermoflexibacter ruber]|uniref:Ligand-binding sensor domain-containing protein n=1 Tax=Thermoflexibacter ruber TaxID=1003 RepID=A0A1I2ICZ6_9BACT|nr:two-component regulator propeller domain-containing protein [Thermoflexibacter ruber]SFF40219.1 ligand-binding sensor domain-containing protein [Thermoflexibacter ruber]